MKYLSLAAIVAVLVFCFSSCSSSKEEVFEPEEDDVCVNIEDEVLRAFCYRTFDLNLSGKVSSDEAEVVYHIDIDDYTAQKTIKSLKGIDVFKNVEAVGLKYAVLTDMKVLYNIKQLKSLDFDRCEIQELDGTKLPDLVSFTFNGTLMSDLDFSTNKALERVKIYPDKPLSLYLPKEMEKYEVDGSKLSSTWGGKSYSSPETVEYALKDVGMNPNVSVVYK